MANIDMKTPVAIYVLWLVMAIAGTALLFTGIQLSVNGNVGIVTPVMLIVIGTIFVFLGLVMVLGYANVEAKAEAMKNTKEDTKKK